MNRNSNQNNFMHFTFASCKTFLTGSKQVWNSWAQRFSNLAQLIVAWSPHRRKDCQPQWFLVKQNIKIVSQIQFGFVIVTWNDVCSLGQIRRCRNLLHSVGPQEQNIYDHLLSVFLFILAKKTHFITRRFLCYLHFFFLSFFVENCRSLFLFLFIFFVAVSQKFFCAKLRTKTNVVLTQRSNVLYFGFQ